MISQEKVQAVRKLIDKAVAQLERELDEWYYLGIIPETWKKMERKLAEDQSTLSQ